MSRISFIVPVYNVEKYIYRCIDSVLALNFTDFELIMVDDAAPDNCPVICDDYATKDGRIKVVHKKKNEGLAAARNSGLELAEGEYILFLDSDDQYDTKKLDELLRSIPEDTPVDVLYAFNFRNVWPDKIETSGPYSKADVKFTDETDILSFLSGKESHKTCGYAIWDKLYSKKLIDLHHIRCLERDTMGNGDDWAEDLSFNLQYFLHIKEIRVLENAPLLLTKHGTPQEQNENTLCGRIGHIMAILKHIYHSDAILNSGTYKDNFWQIAIWHMRRYFYVDAQNMGIDKLRKQCLENAHFGELITWIRTAVVNWSQIADRWDTLQGLDYRYLLEYLDTGNKLKYILQNAFLWKIKSRISRGR